MVHLFGRSVPELCRIVYFMVNFIYDDTGLDLQVGIGRSFHVQIYSIMPIVYTTKGHHLLTALALLTVQSDQFVDLVKTKEKYIMARSESMP